MKARLTIFLTIGAIVVLTYFQREPSLQASDYVYQVYTVTLTGEAGDRPFERGGVLFVLPGDEGGQGSRQPTQFRLMVGTPDGAAGTGALWLATHSGFYGQDSGQLADVTLTDNTLWAQFQAEGLQPSANAFSISAHRAQNADHLLGGEVQLTLALDGSIHGTVHLAGRDPITASPLSYEATLTGTYSGARSW
ncbi:MAG: hypothetical protein R3300_02915 [Candidatus Promineifilaceae bacterium]|nr:hypothetical protein [Candidatus Promineifilaceae bacterium]